jgi:hypothetical protein
MVPVALGMAVPCVVAVIPAQFQRAGTISVTTASSAVNHGENAARDYGVHSMSLLAIRN